MRYTALSFSLKQIRHPVLLLVVGVSLWACDDPGGPLTGTLVVSSSTAGDDPDQDGYLVTVDDVDSLDLDPTGTAKIELASGRHTLRLLGVAGHCSASPGTLLQVEVPERDTTAVAFELSCPATGARIRVTTTGVDIDPDGYRVMVDASDHGAISVSGSILIRLDQGRRTISLTGFAPNCAVDPASRAVTIIVAQVIPIEFAVICTAAPASRILAFEGGGDLYVAHMDGSNLRRLTFDGSPYSYNREAAWSPDGRRIAFSKSDGYQAAPIYVINADGTNSTRLTPEGIYSASPSWSPDGSRIAFETRRDSTGYGGVNSWLDTEIYVMNADGTNPVRLTNHRGDDITPAWSPDGKRIAYVTYDDPPGDAGTHIFVINADGTNRVRLTNDEAFDLDPEWSPDGSRIVFSRSGELFLIEADGTNLASLNSRGSQPDWSPDGLLIAATRATNCHTDPYGESSCHVGIGVVPIGGGPMYELRLGTGFARGPSWGP
jgi:WD40 repeat protein